MSRKLYLFIGLLAVLLFAACGKNEMKDISYNGKYRITTISYSENGEDYEVQAVAGQSIVLFADTVPYTRAKEIIKAGGGKIIEQVPAFNYYLVKIRDGEESRFVSYINESGGVDYAYFNTVIKQLSEIYILDDFVDVDKDMLTTHGNGVRKVFSKYSDSYDIHSENLVFLNETNTSWEKYTTTDNIILSKMFKVAKNVSNDDLTLINMSFGVALPGNNHDTILYSDVNWFKRRLYVKYYADELKELAVILDKMRAKGISNFIVTKASGNEGMHKLQSVFDRLDEKTVQSLKGNFILVSAQDDKHHKLYSNYPTKKHPLLTTVDVTPEPWCGTSFAAPKLMGFIDRVHEKYKQLNANQLLQAIRNATPENPMEPLTYEAFEREAKRIADGNTDNRTHSFELDLTSNYNGEWDLSDGEKAEIVKYKVYNTYDYNYLNGSVNALYLENHTGKNLNIRLNVISSEHGYIRPMFYVLADGESDSFYAYQYETMEKLSVKVLGVQLSTW